MADRQTSDFATITAPGGEAKIHSIFDFTAESLEELRSWLEQAGIRTPVSQLLGFQQFTAQIATTVNTSETTTSTSYTDLTTAGPTLSMMPDGKYIFLFGAAMSNSAGNSLMALNINSGSGSTPLDADSARTAGTAIGGFMRAVPYTLSNGGNNTVKAQYRVSAGTGTWQDRWLFAIRYANP